ncbi:MAG: phosphoribosylformylglycinamidine synthase subunit PurL [Bdellovibrionales bacterium]|nr:phosphoribosylformylglycinamidine synthase subunit PurL [Bdellovibrionales bacterium]
MAVLFKLERETEMIKDTTVSTPELAKQLGVSAQEYDFICNKLERRPNYAELGIFSAMYSEHCSYKSSKPHLRKFPTSGKRVLQGPGENAGILDIGEGWGVAFKMESHNHPSFIEPYQGAATGVGGILRDVFTMGARPIASMNSLCFGDETQPRTPAIVKGVVKGIGDYGNCVGVPTVAGQTFFHPCYNGNPLVNAFTAGIVKHEKIFRASASGIGNVLVYAGAKTGRDGVHGATMASQEFSTEKELERPTVQVGDPFTEKLLLEATLEAMNSGLVLAIQDMGAAGITSSSFEMADRAGTGLEMVLDKIPVRERNLTAYELLLSESQERMLIVTSPDRVEALVAVFEKWDLHAVAVGTITDGKRVRMTLHGEQVVDLPVDLVADPPMADRPFCPPADLKQAWFMDRNKLHIAPLESKIQAVLLDLNFADPRPLAEQYDSMVGNRTQGETFDDAAVLRIREIESKAVRLAFTVDCNPRLCKLAPREGGRRSVAEAAMNLAVRGAEPIGITDCLNFGNPENPEVMWQLVEAVEGITEACTALHTPVVSGNVSLYNDTDGKAIYPTPMIGMVGLIEDALPLPFSRFYSTELELALVGPLEAALGGSVLASRWFKRDCGQPVDTDLNIVNRAIKFCRDLRKTRLTYAAHDISDGGLLSASLEMAFRANVEPIGLKLVIPAGKDVDEVLFGEALPRVLIAYDPGNRGEIENLASRHALPFAVVGNTNDGGTIQFHQGSALLWQGDTAELKARWASKWEVFFN